MTRIVSITRNAVERDTRALKVGSSVARFGYESILIEGEPSSLEPDGLAFELRVLPGGPPPVPPAGAAAGELPASGTLATRAMARLPERVRSVLQPVVSRFGEVAYVLVTLLRDTRRLARSLPAADLYYIHSAEQYPAAWLRARRSGARIVYDAHDANWALDPDADPSAPSRSTLRLLERIDRLCARRVEGFVTVGSALASLLERHVGRRAVVVRNCHDFRLDVSSPSDVRAAAGVPDDAFLMVMTGAPKPGDTVAQALDALE